ncbi:MAG: hypothetical protein KIT84_42330 [Labilithrix sp.]|nr:hypothetical protein [Labilithrix sp.]MCW5817714.1 hypothetical protein [Labilithrix sp.]
MKAGIAASLLVRQVKNTAAWLWTDQPAATRDLDAVANSDGPAPLGAMLTAHWATVATFVPTDVDARIRHHAWQAMATPDEVAAACELVDARTRLDVHAVSARVFDSPRGPLSGHDGEWFSVRAGALARAAQLGDVALTERVAAAIDAELERAEAIFDHAQGDARATLTVATILAHNLGDLSRVVADWPKVPALAPYRDRWLRLGHADAPIPRPAFVVAGRLNKAIMAHENHRFLPLRKPRGLRVARALLLPIGPWLDAWGEMIATSPHLEDKDRAEVLEALLEVHARDGNQEGCLRAIAGLHRATRGGIERYVPALPARMRKDALRGRVRDALDVTATHFAARIAKRLEAARR